VDPRGTARRVLFGQSTNERSYLAGDLCLSATVVARPPAPPEAKACPMPADHSLGFHYDEYVGPTGPQASKCSPEQAVERVQRRPGLLPFKHGQLLPEGEIFKCCIVPTAEENPERGHESKGELEHDLRL